MNPNKEAKGIRETLSYIGRYQSSISPKLMKWKELEIEKNKLRKRLKELNLDEDVPDIKPFRKTKS